MAEEKKNIKFGQIGNAIRSAASDHVTAVASDIFDEDSQKYQNAINAELDTGIKSEAQARTENDEQLSSAISEERNRAMAAEETNAISNNRLEFIVDAVTEGIDSANLYDPSKDVIGNLTTSGTIDTTSTNFKVSDFIFIKAGENFVIPTYTNYEDFDGACGYGIWDVNKNWIVRKDPIATDIERGYMVDCLSINGYIRIKLGKNATNIMVNKGTTPLPYTPYLEPSAVDKKARIELLSMGEEVSKKASSIDLKKTNNRLDSIVDVVTDTITISGTSLNINKENVIEAVISGNDGAEVIHTNRNIIRYPYDDIQVSNGITFTTNPDGSVTAVGTANADSKFFFAQDANVAHREPIKAGQYMLSGCPNGGSNSTYKIIFGLTDVGEFFEYGDGKLIDVANDGTYYCNILIYAGQTVNITFHPQLEKGTSKTEYVFPKKEHIILSSEPQNVELYDGENYFDSTSIMTLNFSKAISQYVILNVKDYGAVGDGVTDDTEAINGALTDATNGVLFIPRGTYLFSGTLFVHTGTKVFGCGANSLLKLANTFSLSSVTWRGDTTNDKVRKPMILLDADSTGCILENFALEGQTYQDHYQDPDDNEDGICVMGSNHILNNLIVHNINYFKDKFVGRRSLTPGWGIDILRAKNISVTNCHVYDCGYENIGTEEVDTILISGCRFGDANQTRAQIHRLSQRIKFVNNTCYATENARKVDIASFTMDANPDVPMDDIKVLNNTLDTHINKVASGENNISIIGNTIKAYGIVDNFKNKWGIGLTITDNVIFGRIGVWSDKALIANNRIEWSDPNYGIAIHVHGNQTLVANNLFTGTYTNVEETPHS